MADICVFQFRGVTSDHRGMNALLTSEPYLSRTTLTMGASTQYVEAHSLADYAVVMPSSGGASCWYGVFGAVNTVTNVVSPGFPERKLVLPAEGDYEMIALPRNGQLGFRGS